MTWRVATCRTGTGTGREWEAREFTTAYYPSKLVVWATRATFFSLRWSTGILYYVLRLLLKFLSSVHGFDTPVPWSAADTPPMAYAPNTTIQRDSAHPPVDDMRAAASKLNILCFIADHFSRWKTQKQKNCDKRLSHPSLNWRPSPPLMTPPSHEGAANMLY